MKARLPVRFAALAPAVAALAIAGCGALPPQAPLADAQKLSVATSGISTACGFAIQYTAFRGNHARDLKLLEAQASTYVQKLVTVFRRNRAWVSQGDTVAEISSDAVSLLESCGLHRAAQQLKRATTAT
jgi:hypothetical protein